VAHGAPADYLLAFLIEADVSLGCLLFGQAELALQ